MKNNYSRYTLFFDRADSNSVFVIKTGVAALFSIYIQISNKNIVQNVFMKIPQIHLKRMMSMV